MTKVKAGDIITFNIVPIEGAELHRAVVWEDKSLMPEPCITFGLDWVFVSALYNVQVVGKN